MRARLLVTLASALVALLGLLWLGSEPAADERPHPFNQDRNAVWLEHRWLEREHPLPEIEALLSGLAARGVRYVFPHLIPFDTAGRLPLHSREQMRAFLATARRLAPDMKVLPWVGGLRVGYKRARSGTVALPDLGQRQRIVAECRGLVDEGFDGIHINVEPVDDGNVDFLSLLRALRTAVGDDRMLSLSAIRPAPFAIPGAPNFAWSLDYYARVGALADQVVVMGYDTGLPASGFYRRYTSWVAATLTRSLPASRARARVLLGIPTYDDATAMHRPAVESPRNALLGVITGLRSIGGGGTFEGVALYAEWTTDAAEWEVYERLWRGKGAARTAP